MREIDERVVGAAAFIAAVLVGFTAAPVEAQDSGFEGGLRLGYGIPLGDVSDGGGDLDDAIAGQIPIWLDLGYRASAHVFIGLYAHYGFGFVGDALEPVCDLNSVDCSASDIRLGAQVHYHVSPRDSLDPWIGAGFGYEWMSRSGEGGGVELSSTLSGFELLHLQLGLDVEASRHFYIGPFLGFSLGQYASVDAECSGLPVCVELEGDIDDKALHEWLVLGVRGAYAP